MPFYARRAHADDLDTLVTFTISEAHEAEGIRQPARTIKEGIRTGIENPSIAMYWVLESEETGVVGSVSIVREWSDWNAAYYWWIQSMFILEKYRGQNLMRLLVDAVREQARKENVREVRLYVHQKNVRAIRAYRRDGFSDAPYQIMTMRP